MLGTLCLFLPFHPSPTFVLICELASPMAHLSSFLHTPPLTPRVCLNSFIVVSIKFKVKDCSWSLSSHLLPSLWLVIPLLFPALSLTLFSPVFLSADVYMGAIMHVSLAQNCNCRGKNGNEHFAAPSLRLFTACFALQSNVYLKAICLAVCTLNSCKL